MNWTNRHDTLLLREILLYEPWSQRAGSVERGQIWKNIADSLNALSDPQFRVTDRSVRDHYKLLDKKYKKKINDENKATGIDVPEESELEQALRNAAEMFHDGDLKIETEKQQKSAAAQAEIAVAEEFRNSSLETFGETRKRNATDSSEPAPKKKQRTGSETITYLQMKHKDELELRKQQLELQKENQQQMHAFMLQQQQVNVALLGLMNKMHDK